jgi:lysophospholipase L1-like esterase
LKPGQQAFTHSFPVITNSYGLRDREFPERANPNTIRILCLGDSLTFGNGVKAEDTYPKQLEYILNIEGQRQRFEVINAGVPAYDTWQEIAYFKEYGWKFKPDLIIIGMYANDIVPKPETVRDLVNEYGALKRFDWSDMLPNELVYLLKRSRVLLLVRDRYGKLMNRINSSPAYEHKLSLLKGTFNEFVENGWKQVEESLGEMSDLAKKQNFGLLLVAFPMSDQIINSYPHSSYPSRVKEIAQTHGILFIDLMPAFLKNYNNFRSLFIEWDGHPNALAYSIAAEEIREYLLRKDVLRNGAAVQQRSDRNL